MERKLSVREKALKINLDRTVYGSFAEIGAGQETAANFFKAGGASGTIAKTMSAYDMKFSDAIYGKSKRYVSEEKLVKMLDHEKGLLLERLSEQAERTRFFVFANTVEILNYHRTNQGHGWFGFRFQLQPNSDANECVIHVLMHDQDPIWQQQALGILGVNLIYGCMYIDDPDLLMTSLLDNLSSRRLEIDFFRIKGPAFEQVDNRLMALKLVKNGLTRATMFDADGTVLQPQEALYKRNTLILRGRFRPITNVNIDMLSSGVEAFCQEEGATKDNIITFSELTLNDLSGEEGISDRDFLDRVDLLGSLGQKVMITDYPKFYMLSAYISQITSGRIRVILGLGTLKKLFEEAYYDELKGGLLESFGILFRKDFKLFVYPTIDPNTGHIMNCDDLGLPDQTAHLYKHLCVNQRIINLQATNTENLEIYSNRVLEMIRTGNQEWEAMVPAKAADQIKQKLLFKFRQL